MHIAFLIPTLGAGGAERVATLLCNYWAERGHRIDVLTFEQPGTEPFYAIHSANLHYLDCVNESGRLAATLLTNHRRVRRVRSLLKRHRPSVVVAFMTDANVIALAGSLGLRVPVIVSERNQPGRQGLNVAHRFARRVSYPFATAIVVQTRSIAAWMHARFRVPVHVIPNPVSPMGKSERTARLRSPDEARRICAVGRLTDQKGFDLLIDSFARLANKYRDWCLAIYGEGPRREALEAKIAQYGLQDRVRLHGLTKDIGKAFESSSVFVLPSRYEGYPNALIEALASGLPVVAADCPGGVAEILGHGACGVLVPAENVFALTEALDTILSDKALRDAFAAKARQTVAKLDLALIGDDWLAILADILAERRRYGSKRWGTRPSKESYF